MTKIISNLPRICFIGCGDIALKHAKILKTIYPAVELSFASRNKNKAKQYADIFKSRLYFGSYKDAFISKTFDIAFITTPHAFHSELAVMAANNHKDIIIEKPVTRNLQELIKIENAVKKNKVRCAVAENYYYKSFIKKIRSYIEEGLIGDVLFIELNKTGRSEKSGWRTNKGMMGGGALLEGGVHWINTLVSLADSAPVEAMAFKPGIKYKTNIPFEDSIMVNVAFKNGVIGKLLHSWKIMNPAKGMSLSKIYGTNGVITFESNGLFFSVHGKKIKIRLANPFDLLGFKAMHKSFIENYINNVPWKPSLDRIKLELRLIESAYKSLKSKKSEII
ncbi:MAG: Gfo/Idh/MocA family oxidoreductase [Spirochaetes bacterium]|nr:Gfo/Idh/MocA family oxidoreductase [Spirochaetota bacterium]